MHRLATLLLLCLLGACAAPPARDGSVRVTYTFENMRRFVDPSGEPISRRDEWALVEDLIESLRKHFHVQSNRFGATFETSREVDAEATGDLRTATYRVSLVVRDLEQLHKINQRVDALRGRQFGPAQESAQVDPYAAAINYRSGFFRADLRVVLAGQAEPGTVVYLYDGVLDEPRRIVAGQAGRWESAVNVSEGQRNIYGYFMDARARMPVYFRVNIATRIFEEIDRETMEAEFPRDYPGRRFRHAPPADAG